MVGRGDMEEREREDGAKDRRERERETLNADERKGRKKRGRNWKNDRDRQFLERGIVLSSLDSTGGKDMNKL